MGKCVLCKNKTVEKLFSVRGRNIVRCQKCGLVRTDAEGFEQYDDYHRDEKEYIQDEEIFRNIFQKRYNNIIKFKKTPGKILDIGASTGTLLSIFQKKGWEVWGVEPSNSADYAKKRDIKMIKSVFEKAKLPNNYFDIVVMNHTFEHVSDPVSVLGKIKKVLKKGGAVYIDVPNFGSLDSSVKGSRWGYLMPEEHTFHYTPESLVKIFDDVGLEVVSVATWSGIFDVSSPVNKFWYDLTNFRLAFFKDFIKIPFNIVTTMLNRGTSLAVIGRKR